MPPPRTTLLLALAACALAPASALGATGGTSAGGTSPGTGGNRDGGAPVGQPVDRDEPAPTSGSRPVLTSFEVRGTRFFAYGSPPRVSFRVDAKARTVRVRVDVYANGRRVRTIDLGDRTTGATHVVAIRGPLPDGRSELRIAGRDAKGRSLRRGPRAASSHEVEVRAHRFPLIGAFTYGGEGSRFSAGRGNRLHQGQDLSAAEGTPVVAPRGGTIRVVAYQAGGAGNYIVLQGAGESRSYVFMHLQDSSTRVRVGQTVRTGTRLANVGSTGGSSGPHLHFEIWEGAWQGGGHPIDPLPDLRRWDAWS